MSKRLKLIAIVGMPGAGKTIAANFFQTKGIAVLRFGDQTDIGLHELGLQRNEANERMYREKLRSELGMEAMAIKIEPRILATAKEHSIIVLDGLYSWEEYVYLKGRFPELTLLCIYVSPILRQKRLKIRKVRPLTVEETKSRDIAEIENLHKGGPIAVADYLIKNEGNQKDFEKELEKFYSSAL